MKAFAPALLTLALSACAVGPDYRAPTTEPARIAALEARAVSLEEKMAEIRVVNRAKWALIDRRGLTEAAAHRLIEQAAMNGRMTSADAARRILAELAPEDKI